MKQFSAYLSALLCLCMLSGCMGTPVVYHADCDCPTDGTDAPTSAEDSGSTPDLPAAEGELKTGLALMTDISGSTSASDEKNGEAKYDVTMVAVLVDGAGVIWDCIIDGIASSVTFDAAGGLTSDVNAAILTKNELGADYGMVAWGGAIAEWDKQAQALADYAIGKTVEELKNGAIDETGCAPEGSDLASSATIYLGGYVSAIAAAVDNAVYRGAEGGDQLRMASVSSVSGSRAASAESAGIAQLEVTVTAMTMQGDVITSCVLDSVQAKVGFDTAGALTTDPASPVKTKNELGADYGMVAWGGAIAEWDEQADAFAAYVTGKTPSQVMGIAVNEGTKPTEADLASSVTIAVGGFQALIEKAAQ